MLETIGFWVALISYFIAMIGYAFYLGINKKIIVHIANALMGLGFVVHTIALIHRWIISGHPPLTDMYEYSVLFSWAIVLSYLIILARYKMNVLGAFVAPVALLLIAIASLLPNTPKPNLVPALQSIWLQLHVSLAVLGEGAFAISFAASIMYLMKQYSLTEEEQKAESGEVSKLSYMILGLFIVGAVFGGVITGFLIKYSSLTFPQKWYLPLYFLTSSILGIPFFVIMLLVQMVFGKKLPNLKILDEISYKAISVGYPLFTIGALVFGAIWAHLAWGTFWSWDPKETGSLVVWLIYSAYLHSRYVKGWRGSRAAILAVLGFISALLTLVANLVLGGLHSYL